MTKKKAIYQLWFKDWTGTWRIDNELIITNPDKKESKERLQHVRQHLAINGKADIFRVGSV